MGPIPIPAESLRDSGVQALVETLQALIAESGRLRAAVADAEGALTRLETELQHRSADLESAESEQARLGTLVVESEAELRRLDDERRRWTETRRRPSPPAGTLPLVKRSQLRQDGAVPPPGPYEEVLRRHAERVTTTSAHRRDLRVVEQRVRITRQDVAAKADETEQRRGALAILYEKVAQVPDEATLVAQIAAALDAAPRETTASQFALTDIPPDLLAVYRRAAATCPGLSWAVLAAIGSVESAHGRADLAGVHSGTNSAGAMGPMQFLAETWAAYGVDEDRDGKADVYQPGDAVFGAANYLCQSGAGERARLASALWAYNHADWYVASVLARAAAYGIAGLAAAPAQAAALVDHPNLTLSDEARADLISGATDARVVAVLAAAAAEHRIAVTVIKTGHAQFVRGTDRVSNHYHGRGIDISSVEGLAVSASNHAALGLAVAFLTADPAIRPDELGSPWPELNQFVGAFSDADHAGHLHLGWHDTRKPEQAEGMIR